VVDVVVVVDNGIDDNSEDDVDDVDDIECPDSSSGDGGFVEFSLLVHSFLHFLIGKKKGYD